MANRSKLLLHTMIDEWTHQHVADAELIADAYSGALMTPEAEAVWLKIQALYRKMVDDAYALLATLPDN